MRLQTLDHLKARAIKQVTHPNLVTTRSLQEVPTSRLKVNATPVWRDLLAHDRESACFQPVGLVTLWTIAPGTTKKTSMSSFSIKIRHVRRAKGLLKVMCFNNQYNCSLLKLRLSRSE